MTSEELFERWAGGDAAAGSELFDLHFPSLYRFFRNKAPDAVEDLIQDTMLACVRSKAGFRGDSSFRTYLFTVARHELYAHLDRRRKKSDREGELGSMSVADLGTSPPSAIARRRDLDLMLRALRALPLDLQVALELHYFEELGGAEMAEILEVPEGTVRSRLRRAKEALAKKMEEVATAGDEAALRSSRIDFDGWASGVKRAFDEDE